VSARIDPTVMQPAFAEKILEPQSAAEVADIVRKCEGEHLSLAPLGAARTLTQIRRAPVAIGISLAQMTKIVAYEPEDMTVIVEPGITVGTLNAKLAQRGQRLPVDPRHPESTTVGALIAAAHAGPLRHCEGTVRDLLIGIQFAGHGGNLVRAGGRVVKNVAGYDLMKVMIGSFGTLGIVTEATFKVRPIPENYSLALAGFDDARDAFAAASNLNDRLPLVHLEIASAAVAGALGRSDRFLMLAGFAGIRSELDYQRSLIADAVAARAEFCDGDRADAVYRALRDFDFPQDALAARVAVLPGELSRCLSAAPSEFVAHTGTGVAEVWSVDAAMLPRLREAAHSVRGHVRVLSAPAPTRGTIDFFDQPDPGALKLMKRMKAAFDPAGIFNPGCFVGGI
jgi:glycolate oxidase FAD binding subunit